MTDYSKIPSLVYNGKTINNPKKNNGAFVAGIVLVIVGSQVGLDLWTADIGLSIVFFAVGLLGCFIVYKIQKKNKLWYSAVAWHKQQDQQKAKQEIIDQFYEECSQYGRSCSSNTAFREKLVLIAQKYKLANTVDAAMEIYTAAHERRQIEKDQQEKEQKEAKLKQEQSLMKQNRRYLSYSGREKMVKMYTDLANEKFALASEYAMQASKLKSSGGRYYDLSRERESDWASVGGAVSAIAGSAAGITAAIDVQNQNADVRARNSQLLHSVAELTVDGLIKIWEKERYAKESGEKYRELADKAKLKLCEERDSNELLTLLKPTASKIEKMDTGSVRFTVNIGCVKNITIYDSVSAVIDGHIRAVLKANGKTVGKAELSLACNGSGSSHSVDCICQNVKEAEGFTVAFEPINLWAIED